MGKVTELMQSRARMGSICQGAQNAKRQRIEARGIIKDQEGNPTYKPEYRMRRSLGKHYKGFALSTKARAFLRRYTEEQIRARSKRHSRMYYVSLNR